MNNKEKLVNYLKEIWNDKDFIVGVISNAATEENFEKIIRFIDYSKEHDEPFTSDDIVALSVVVDKL